MTKPRNLFQAVEMQIAEGNLARARLQLRKVGSLQKLTEPILLNYFRLMRRVGEFDRAAIQIEKLGLIFPQLVLERAYLLGECGAIQQAITLLDQLTLPLSKEDHVDRYLQLGNFYSLLHQYDKAVAAYQNLESVSRGIRPMHSLIGRLNTLGHRIYGKTEIENSFSELQEFRRMSKYPLLQQGGFYFSAMAEKAKGNAQAAQDLIQKAFEVGVEHRLRESLLLRLTEFDLNPIGIGKAQISRLKKLILNQVHILYWDQFNKIMAKRALLEKKEPAARRYLLKVIFGQRQHLHFFEALDLWNTHWPDDHVDLSHWKVCNQLPETLSSRQRVLLNIQAEDLPVLRLGRRQYSLQEESRIMRSLTMALAKYLEFPVRDAELWEVVWQQPFNFMSSPPLIRSTISRWRSCEIADFAEIETIQRRVALTLKKDATLYCSEDKSAMGFLVGSRRSK